MKTYISILFASFLFVFSTKDAGAVPPPDFLFAVGASISVVFSFLAIFFTAVLATIRQFAKKFFNHLKHKKIFWGTTALIVVVVSFSGAYFYKQYEQDQAYDQWVAESEKQNQGLGLDEFYLDKLTKVEPTETTPPVPVMPKNPNLEFIETYYGYLNDGEIENAYAASKKSVSLDVYTGWYKNVQSANVDNIQEIDEDTYSLRVKLVEFDTPTYYAVLMTVGDDENGNKKIIDSESKIIDGIEKVETGNVNLNVVEDAPTSTSYFDDNKNTALEVGNNEFKNIIDSSNNVFVLDAREDEEYEIGYFPGSHHIRFADLLSGQWVSLPADKTVYVFCWSGIRGEEVATFLRQKGILARYVETGADGWVSFGGDWNGGIKFSSKYGEARYTKLFDLDGLKAEMNKGTVIVDSRMSAKYDSWHIPGSYNIPIIYTPSVKIQESLAQVPSNSSVITVCDDFISCFDAKITGVKLEKAGHTFLGRYNKPWEYSNNQ